VRRNWKDDIQYDWESGHSGCPKHIAVGRGRARDGLIDKLAWITRDRRCATWERWPKVQLAMGFEADREGRRHHLSPYASSASWEGRRFGIPANKRRLRAPRRESPMYSSALRRGAQNSNISERGQAHDGAGCTKHAGDAAMYDCLGWLRGLHCGVHSVAQAIRLKSIGRRELPG